MIGGSFLLWLPMALALPDLEPHQESGIHSVKPAGWKTLVTPSDHTVTHSEGLFTTVRVQWFPTTPELTGPSAATDWIPLLQETALQSVQDILDSNTPIGTWKVLSRGSATETPVVARFRYSLLGYELDLGVHVIADLMQGRVVTGLFLSNRERFDALGGLDLLAQVVDSLHTSADLPHPYPPVGWPFAPPTLLARDPPTLAEE